MFLKGDLNLKARFRNKTIELEDGISLTTFLDITNTFINDVSVLLINGIMIPTSKFDEVVLKEGDEINIVPLVAGG